LESHSDVCSQDWLSFVGDVISLILSVLGMINVDAGVMTKFALRLQTSHPDAIKEVIDIFTQDGTVKGIMQTMILLFDAIGVGEIVKDLVDALPWHDAALDMSTFTRRPFNSHCGCCRNGSSD